MRRKIEAEFEYRYKCIVIMTDMGHRCGYVGLPKSHPLYGINYNECHKAFKMKDLNDEPIDKRGILPLFCNLNNDSEYVSADVYFNVHGGVTYTGDGLGFEENEDNKLWYFGYDCAHAGDAKNLDFVEDKELRRIFGKLNIGEIRTLDYCIQECKNLADQLWWVEMVYVYDDEIKIDEVNMDKMDKALIERLECKVKSEKKIEKENE